MSLITADTLAHRLDGDNPPVLCDVRFYLADHDQGRRVFDEGHLPGAVFVDLHHDLADVSIPNAGRHPLPRVEDFAATLGRLGITPETKVVAYDDHGGAMAARLWWMLDAIGHEDVAVLDGGIGAWTAAGYSLSTDAPLPTPVTYAPARPDWADTVDADTIGDGPDRGFAVVDSRAPQRYRGEVEPLDPRAGHIPGAINRFHGDVVSADGTFRSPDELDKHFDGLGDRPVIYCGSGVTACHNLLALRIAGRDDGLLYPGSWSEWSSNPKHRIATGDEAS